MELDILSDNFQIARKILSVWSYYADTFPKALSIVLLFKLAGLMGDIAFGYQLLVTMTEYTNKDAMSTHDIMLVIFFLGVTRILHLPILGNRMLFGFGLKPMVHYRTLYDEEQLNHLYKALWYGSLFLCDEYLAKIYVSTHDVTVGLCYLIILMFESGIAFYLCMLQGTVLPKEESPYSTNMTCHYLIIVWFVTSSFYGLLQNWYVWYKQTTEIHFNYYVALSVDDIENSMDDESDIDIAPTKSYCQIFSFCLTAICLNAFSCIMFMYAFCVGVAFLILFSIWVYT
eukprot:91859_1